MSDESGKWGPYRSINRRQSVPQVLKMLGNACEAAMANGFDLMPGIIPQTLLDNIDALHRTIILESQNIATALQNSATEKTGPKLVKEA